MENGHVENKQKFLFIQIGLNSTSLKKGKRYLLNEHLDHEDSIFAFFF